MSTLSIPSIVIASITFYVGLYHLIVYLRRRQYRENLTFALMCFVVGLYDISCAGLYSVTFTEASLPWLRGQVVILALITAAFAWFIADYTSHQPRRILLSLSVCFMALAIIGLLDHDGWMWRPNQPSIKVVRLPIAGQITYYEVAPGPLTNSQSLLGVLVFVYVLWVGVRYFKGGQRRRAVPLLLATVLLFAGVFNDAAVANGLYSFPYVFEYAFMGMVLLMAYSLSDAVVQAAAMQEALRQSEERYRRLVTASPDSILLTDMRGNILLGNQQAATLHGFERVEDVIGKNILDYIVPEDRRRAIREIRCARESGAVKRMQFNLLTKDGRRFPAEISVSVITDKDGQVAGYIGLTRDIAERIGAEAELLVRRARLKAIFDNAGVGICVMDHNGYFVQVNDHLSEMLGYPPEELVQKTELQVTHTDDAVLSLERMQALTCDATDRIVMEKRYIRRDGSLFWVSLYATPIRDPQGGLEAIIGFVTDITERKRAEEALREAEARYRTLVERMPAIVYIDRLDESSSTVYISPQVEAVLGYSPDEWTADPEFWVKLIHPNDRERALAENARTNITGEPFRMEYRLVARDGRIVWIRDEAVALHDSTGRPQFWQGVMLDITERKQAEEALHMTQYSLDHASEAVFWIDSTARFVYVNDSACRALGYSRQELLSMSVPHIEPLFLLDRWAAQWQAMEQRGSMTFESLYRAKDGRTFPVEITASRLDFSGKRYQHVFARDITERKRAEEALRQSEERLSLVLEGNKDGFWDWDLTTGMLEFSRRYVEMLGYTQEELEPSMRTWEQMVHPEDRSMAKQTLDAHLDGRASYYECEYRFRTKSGKWKWMLDRGKVVARDEHGKPLRMAGTHTDITERKQVEAERERLLLDLAYRSTQLQTAAEVSKSASTILALDALMQQAVDLIKDRFSFYYVGIFLVDEEGQSAVLRAGTGEPGRQMLAAGHRLAIGEGSMIGYCIAHARARITLDADEDAIRYKNPYLPLTRSEMALPLLTRGKAIGALTVQSTHDGAFAAEDISVLQTMADQLAIAIENAWLYEASQQEIAKRRQAEEKVRKLNEELEQRVIERTAQLQAATRELETFAYSVSHDLKAPLRGIDGYSHLLLEDYADKLDDEGRQFLRTIRQATEQMRQLIDDLLSYSRLERRSFTTGAVNPRTLIESIIAERAGDPTNGRVNLVVNVPCTSVVADPAGLAQALRNLIDNAFKFTRDVPEPRVQVGGRETENTCILWVRDNGVGFDMQYHDRIFEIFQRLHRVEEYPGTGVGLAIVRKAMQRMGGRVWAESAPGAGATFYLEIPKS